MVFFKFDRCGCFISLYLSFTHTHTHTQTHFLLVLPWPIKGKKVSNLILGRSDKSFYSISSSLTLEFCEEKKILEFKCPITFLFVCLRNAVFYRKTLQLNNKTGVVTKKADKLKVVGKPRTFNMSLTDFFTSYQTLLLRFKFIPNLFAISTT